MHPWDFVVVNGVRGAVVHVGVLHALQRVARELGEGFELPAGVIGAAESVHVVARLSEMLDRLEHGEDVAWLAVGATNVALGEWSHGAVDVTARGVFIDGSKVRGWDSRVAMTERGEVPLPHSLACFAPQALVVAASQDQAWRRHAVALSRAIAQAPLRGEVLVEYVATDPTQSTVSKDEEPPTPTR